MSAHAEALHGHDGHRGPPTHHSSRIDPRTSGCSCSSGRRSCSSARSSRPTSSAGRQSRRAVAPAGSYEFPVFVAGMNTCILVTSSFTMHWALQSIKRRERKALLAGIVLTFLLGLAFLLHAARRVPERRLQHRRRRVRLRLLRPYGPAGCARRVGLSLLLVVSRSAASAGTTPPSTTTGSSSPGSTGTSSTSCGSSCIRPSTSSDDVSCRAHATPAGPKETPSGMVARPGFAVADPGLRRTDGKPVSERGCSVSLPARHDRRLRAHRAHLVGLDGARLPDLPRSLRRRGRDVPARTRAGTRARERRAPRRPR